MYMYNTLHHFYVHTLVSGAYIAGAPFLMEHIGQRGLHTVDSYIGKLHSISLTLDVKEIGIGHFFSVTLHQIILSRYT